MIKQHRLPPSLHLLALAAAALACGSVGPATSKPPDSANTITATPGPGELFFSPGGTATASATRTPGASATLKSELFFGGYGGGGSTICDNAWPDLGAHLPAVGGLFYFSTDDLSALRIGSLCLYGFPFDDEITITLSMPTGEVVSSGKFMVEKISNYGGSGYDEYNLAQTWPPDAPGSSGFVSPTLLDGTPVSIIEVGVVWPANFPNAGVVVAESASAQAAAEISVGTPRLTTLVPGAAGGINVFDLSSPCYSDSGAVDLYGTGFDHDSDVPFGFYFSEEDADVFALVRSITVAADADGNFHTSLSWPLDPSDPAGQYSVIAVVNAETDNGYAAGPRLCFRIPSPAGDQPTRLNGPTIHADRLPAPPAIDGRADDWNDLPYAISDAVYKPDNVSGPGDNSANFAVGWDADFLYTVAFVTDEALVQTQHGALIFKGDSLELMLDGDLAGDFDDAHLSADDFQLGLSPGNLTTGNPPAQSYQWYPADRAGAPPGVAVAAAPLDSGYVVEAAIPWSVFNRSPTAGDHFGFALSVSDNDTPGTAEQQSLISIVGTRKLTDPTTWGTLILDD
ncbi:MAG: sugar-binding protein [Chloroflexota bacterium]